MNPKKALAALAAAFRVEKLEPETAALYAAKLSDISGPLLEQAVHEIVSRSKFFPSIAEIRETAARIAGILPPGVEEVLAIVRASDVAKPVTRRDGSYAYTEHYWEWPEDTPRYVRQLIFQVLDKVGDPVDMNGKHIFGWEQGFKASYERVAKDETTKALRALGAGSKPKELPE